MAARLAPRAYLDELQPLRPLGEGALARVDLVRDPRDGATYALKWTPEEDADGCHELLRREFRFLRRLRHPRLPQAHDLGLAAGSKRTWPTTKVPCSSFAVARRAAGAMTDS